MKDKVVFIIVGVTILTLIFFNSYTSYAFRIDAINSENQLLSTTDSIDVKIDFEIDQIKKGIPGEVVSITKTNAITKKTKKRQIAFLVNYKAFGNIDVIDNITLSGGNIELVKDEERSNELELYYYGVILEEDEVHADLGDIEVEFKAGVADKHEIFKIEAEVIACPRDENSIKTILGVNPVGRYAKLVK